MDRSIVLLSLVLAGCAFAEFRDGQVNVSSFGNGCAVVRHGSDTVAACARAIDIGPLTDTPIRPGDAKDHEWSGTR